MSAKRVYHTQHVLDYLLEHANQPVRLTALAAAVGISEAQAQRSMYQIIYKGRLDGKVEKMYGGHLWRYNQDQPAAQRSRWDQDEDAPDEQEQEQEQAAEEQQPAAAPAAGTASSNGADPSPMPRVGQTLRVVYVTGTSPTETVILCCEDERRYAATLVAL